MRNPTNAQLIAMTLISMTISAAVFFVAFSFLWGK